MLERRINQYIVEVFYNYLLRVSYVHELRAKDGGRKEEKDGKEGQGEHPTVLEMFKMINLINVLFELREPCRFLLDSFVNVFVIEQLVVLVY